MTDDSPAPSTEARPAPPARPSSSARRELAVACGALAIGAGAALGALSRTWVEITAARAAPLPAVHVSVTGRSLSPAAGALALVLLAGAVAVLATAGRARQALGAVLGLLSVALIWVAVSDATGVSDAQARRVLDDRFSGIGLAGSFPVEVSSHVAWSWLCAAGGVLCLAGSIAVLARGGRWRAMAARYDRPAAPDAGAANDSAGPGGASRDAAGGADAPRDDASGDHAAVTDLSLWNALDRGDDPTRR